MSFLKGKIFFFIFQRTKKFLKKEGKGKIPFSKKILYFILEQIKKTSFKADFVKIQGHGMFLDSKDSLKLTTRDSFESNTTELIKKMITKGESVIDIGANIGYFTLIFAKIVGAQGQVFAFEPDTENFNLLKKNISYNNYENVTVENLALSDFTGKTKLYISKYNNGMHRIYPSLLCTEDFININVKTLDDYLEKIDYHKKISFVKIDVEGSELNVLRGMKSIIEKNKILTILLEFVPASLIEAKNDPMELLCFLKEYNFEIYSINSITGNLEIENDVKNLHDRFDKKLHSKSIGANLFCIRKA